RKARQRLAAAQDMGDVKAGAAEIVPDHLGEPPVVLDKKDARAHGISLSRRQPGPNCRDARWSRTFARCSGVSTSAASARACETRLLKVSASATCSARKLSMAVRSTRSAVRS